MTVSYSSPNTANIITPFPSTNTVAKNIIPMYVASILSLELGGITSETMQEPKPKKSKRK